MNISDAGDDSCFRHGAPCGKQPSGSIKMTYAAGKPVTVFWQQNYNHYTVGYPGLMDIGLSTNPEPTSDDDFEIVGVVPDYNAHWQGAQRNFTFQFITPDVECQHCVLRARYQSHKPGETTFYQCADIAITHNPERVSEQQPPFAVDQSDAGATAASESAAGASATTQLLYGVQCVTENNDCEFVQVSTSTGTIVPRFKLPFDVHAVRPVERKQQQQQQLHPSKHVGDSRVPRLQAADEAAGALFLADQVCAVDSVNGFIYYLLGNGPIGSLPSFIVRVRVASNKYDLINISNIAQPINALNYDNSTGKLFAITLEESPVGSFAYVTHVNEVDLTAGTLTPVITTKEADDTFINLQWTELDGSNGLLYVLYQDENEAVKMDSILLVFDINSRTYRRLVLDYKTYIVTSHYIDHFGRLLTLSPGLVYGNNTWTLVQYDLANGGIVPLSVVVPPNTFAPYYGGAIYQPVRSSGRLFYRFRLPSPKMGGFVDLIAYVDLNTYEVRFSPANRQLPLVHNLAML